MRTMLARAALTCTLLVAVVASAEPAVDRVALGVVPLNVTWYSGPDGSGPYAIGTTHAAGVDASIRHRFGRHFSIAPHLRWSHPLYQLDSNQLTPYEDFRLTVDARGVIPVGGVELSLGADLGLGMLFVNGQSASAPTYGIVLGVEGAPGGWGWLVDLGADMSAKDFSAALTFGRLTIGVTRRF